MELPSFKFILKVYATAEEELEQDGIIPLVWLTGDHYEVKCRNTVWSLLTSELKKNKVPNRRNRSSYLTMCINYRSQQLPGPSPAVHADHAQDLKETEATQRRCGEDVTLATGWNHGNRGNEYDDVWRAKAWKRKVTGSTILATGTVVDSPSF